MDWSFFYSTQAPFVKMYSAEHVAYLVFCAAAVFWFIRSRNHICAHRRRTAKIFLGVMAFQQVFLLYGWYALATDVFWSEGLPLHLCRVASLLTIVFLLTENTKVLDVVFYFSIFALISLFYPMNVYHFAHVSGLSYMINHLITVLIPIFGFVAYGWRPSWAGCRRAIIAFTVYFPAALVANALTGGNYFYMTDRPFLKSIPLWLFASLAYLVTVAGFTIVTAALLYIAQKTGKSAKKVCC